MKLAPLQRADTEAGHRDGLAALMAFVVSFTDTARRSVRGTWEGLQRPKMKKVVRTLWTQAETVLASSCGIPAIGLEDRKYIAFICNRSNGDGLAGLLGLAPDCPAACLSAGTASAGGSIAR